MAEIKIIRRARGRNLKVQQPEISVPETHTGRRPTGRNQRIAGPAPEVEDAIMVPESEIPTLDGYAGSGLKGDVIDKLKENGFETLAEAQAAEDEALLAIAGIGPATVSAIKDA